MISIWLRTVSAVGMAAAIACAADLDRPEVPASSGGKAPVLHGSEPVDTGVFTLPGRPAPPPRVLKPFNETVPEAKVPLLPEVPAARLPVPALESPLPPPKRALKPFRAVPSLSSPIPVLPDLPPATVAKSPSAAAKLPGDGPMLRRSKVWVPPDFEKDSAAYCQQRIGEWLQPDAYNLLGTALRQRPAAGEDGEVAGQIYAFADPTGRYREIELDFAGDTGLLRTVFVYPKTMTWLEARRMWGEEVSATDANKGRMFYSFTNRRLDVLVGPDGKVISLGLY